MRILHSFPLHVSLSPLPAGITHEIDRGCCRSLGSKVDRVNSWPTGLLFDPKRERTAPAEQPAYQTTPFVRSTKRVLGLTLMEAFPVVAVVVLAPPSV